MRRSGEQAGVALLTMPLCASMAQRTASTTLRNSTSDPVAGALDQRAHDVPRRCADRSDHYEGPAAAPTSDPHRSDSTTVKKSKF